MIHISSKPFSTTHDSREVIRYIMQNDNGMRVSLLSYACTVQSIIVPDRNGHPTDVVLGYDSLEDYERGTVFLGAFVGRYANRIKNSEFMLNGKTYSLEKNDGNNHLHGIFCHDVFDGRIDGDSVVFTKYSPSSDEGYPGNLTLEIRYILTEDNALDISYRATTDEDTVVNFTNHSYFNLNGADGSEITGHMLKIDADTFTEADAETLPTGRILSVASTPLDFRSSKRIGDDIDDEYDQIRYGHGYDHNFILNGPSGELREFAEAWSDRSGIFMSCSTTEPAVQFYSGNYLEGDMAEHGKGGVKYPNRSGFCLEAQHYPCSPNFPEFPSTVLKKGEVYHQETVYRFSIK